MTYSQICYDVIRAVATITLNRPERLNAWTPTMAAEFRQAMEQANNDPQVRAIGQRPGLFLRCRGSKPGGLFAPPGREIARFGHSPGIARQIE